jgi:hypothetical protein
MEKQLEFVLIVCPTKGCHCIFALPDGVNDRLRESKETFHCPFGHGQSYGGDTEVQRLKRVIENKNEIINAKDKFIVELQKPKRKPRKVTKKKK